MRVRVTLNGSFLPGYRNCFRHNMPIISDVYLFQLVQFTSVILVNTSELWSGPGHENRKCVAKVDTTVRGGEKRAKKCVSKHEIESEQDDAGLFASDPHNYPSRNDWIKEM